METRDPDWLDRMYNNRALVPGYEDHFRRWAELSAEVTRSQHRLLDVRYGGGPGEHLDIFPASQADAPVVVFIHGGYWRSLDKREHAFVVPTFTRAGACVVLPNYALCPAVTIPDIVMQMVRALAWTWRNIAAHGGDRRRITVIGHSAGGQLAAMMLACVWRAFDAGLPDDLVRNALAISPVYDLEPLMHAPFVQPSLQLTPEQVMQASPARLPAPDRGELFTVAGADESAEFVRQNTLIREAWGAQRVPVCETVPDTNHFSVLEKLAEPGHRLQALALDLVKRTR